MSPEIASHQAPVPEAMATFRGTEPTDGEVEFDLSLLEGSLRLTPWERMQANDDALNLGESLRAAMESRNAEP